MANSSDNRAYAARMRAKDGLTEAGAKEMSDKDIETARLQFEAIYEAEREMRARIKADHEYVDGVHADGTSLRWSKAKKDARGDRASFSIDAMSGPISQVSNGLAESKPAADMMPIGGGADVEKAEVWEGLLRRIQTTPEAEYAGAYAADHLTKLGVGAWVLTARYPEYNGKPDDPANWEMELCREWVENQHAVWVGPATKPDGSDRLCGFILQPLTEDLFDERLGAGEFKANKSAFEDMSLVQTRAMSAWDGPLTVTVATWYRVKSEDVTITGTGPDGQPVTRTVKSRKVCVSTITATKEYEYSELPIPYVPIVFGKARASNIDGAKDVKGMVRPMKEPQDLVNYWASEIPAMVAMSSRIEVVAATGQTENQPAGMWELDRRFNGPRTYDPVTVDGTLAPPPAFQTMEAPIQAQTLALQQAESFVRKAAGAYDADSDQTRASLSKESGVARKERRQQSEMGNSDFARAYAFMLLFEIKVLMAWAPHVYSSARVMRITGRDEEEMAVVTHFGQQFAENAAQLQSQVPVDEGEAPISIFDLSVGRYDVKARIAKNPLTQREENVEMAVEMLPLLSDQQRSKAVPVVLDEMEGTMMKRVSAAINPKEQTVSIEDAKKAQMMIDVLTQKVEELEQAQAAKAADNESKEKIAMAQIAADLEKAKLDAEIKLTLAEFDLKKQAMQAEIDAREAQLAHERGMESGEHMAATEFALRPEPEPANGDGMMPNDGGMMP